MPVTIDLTDDAVMVALRTAFLVPAISDGNIEVVQGQVNRVPTVKGPNYVVFWPVQRLSLSQTVDTWAGDAPTTGQAQQSTLNAVQVDFHGDLGANLMQQLTTLWSNDWAFDALAATGLNIRPLYSDQALQVPMITEGEQYETKWSVRLVMQINPIVSTTQEFADTVTVGLVEVDTTYPPGA